MPEADDPYDYSMSDQFISETRQRPYRTGFRARSWREARCFEDAMRLDDRNFKLWIANRAGRGREPQRGSATTLHAIQAEVNRLHRQVDELSKALHQRGNTATRGLDVAAR
ncbi:MAG: hypothetical protein K2Q17_00050 [Nitrospiraceae bacterium]|jgi:hypothetical protein|uniref:hypothetical protein n=1 Tax=Nitrospira cf. moscoviensis SBR1015 TaxID=96242 RepID=UPI000A0EC17F|nr:hypothetical protein [Nitrospira cf. moscoviensis SBR1015]MBY0246026.1 hypothetical protein [Nitrospiraceae bacterium]OQW34041.1 MAG: hypothetical protein A4E20_18220 [Nitrospira sp. SG-bin2]